MLTLPFDTLRMLRYARRIFDPSAALDPLARINITHELIDLMLIPNIHLMRDDDLRILLTLARAYDPTDATCDALIRDAIRDNTYLTID